MSHYMHKVSRVVCSGVIVNILCGVRMVLSDDSQPFDPSNSIETKGPRIDFYYVFDLLVFSFPNQTVKVRNSIK